jgi:SagB-type dehydrogenase family enzyme
VTRTADPGLPPLDRDDPLSRALLGRRSERQFSGAPLPLRDLSDMLRFAYGAGALVQLEDGRSAFSHPVPSADGLYPLYLYIAVGCVVDLTAGLYRYRPYDHALDRVGHGPIPAELVPLLLGRSCVERAGAVMFIAAAFERSLSKYGPRGYRYCPLEAGHAAQNLCLVACSRGCASVCLGGFGDARLNAALGFDGRRRAVLYAVAIGASPLASDGDAG